MDTRKEAVKMRSSGHFSFCNNCPADLNCCTGKNVDLPVLTPQDVQRIIAETGLNRDDFCQSVAGEQLSTMKAREGACHFYRKGKCTIYNVRPVDCRIFPFDIDRTTSGELVWIVYSSACPNQVDARKHLREVQPLLPLLQPYLEEFASRSSPCMEEHDCHVLSSVAAAD